MIVFHSVSCKTSKPKEDIYSFLGLTKAINMEIFKKKLQLILELKSMRKRRGKESGEKEFDGVTMDFYMC